MTPRPSSPSGSRSRPPFAQALDARGGRTRPRRARKLLFLLGDQLDRDARALRELDRERDVVLLAEVAEESTHVPVHRQRIALFLAAMRHATLDLAERGFRVRHVRLDDAHRPRSLASELGRAIESLGAERVLLTEPGDHRVAGELERECARRGVPLEILPDESFTCGEEEFEAWAAGRRELVMEYFYRDRRRRLGVLVEEGKPAGGRWNFDRDNRKGIRGHPGVRPPIRFRPDPITREVLELVERRFPDAPGRLDSFDWPVTPAQARRALRDFVAHRLAGFGTWQDAMGEGEPLLHHSRLAAALNLKLLRPRECVEAAVAAGERGDAPLNDVEGFVRQILGWREFVRGVWRREGPAYLDRNELDHRGQLPPFFWTGDTELNCLRNCLGEVIESAYGHHIPRLMVIGNFALLAGVEPRRVHDWFLGMYADAVEWVTAPNVIGMSQHADGGIVGTKPYAASGKYVDRMSDYCAGCRFDPTQRTGPDACPFNALYWDFLLRHRRRFARNRRMAMIVKGAERLDPDERRRIRRRASEIRRELGVVAAGR
jgi:deoxyribodipyrimidine photolyase-related protein